MKTYLRFALIAATGISAAFADVATPAQTTAPANAPASAPTTPPSSAATPANDVVVLPQVDVTAASEGFATSATAGVKTSTLLIETPQTISVISQRELELRNVKGVAEALRYTAGVTTDTYGEDPRGYAWANIRGFEVGFQSQYLDGLRLTNYEFTEVYGLQQIEVLKGPSSVLYGQTSPGGLISNISKRPTTSSFGEITAEIGDGESYETTLDVGGPLDPKGKFLYRITALFNDTNENSNGYDVDAQRTFVAPAFTWRISDSTSLTFLTSFYHTESTQIPSLAAGPAGEFTGVYTSNKNWDLEENDIYRVGYELEHRATADLTFKQNARVSRYDVYDRYLNANGYLTPTLLDRTASIWQSKSFSMAVDNRAELKLTGDRIDQTLLAGFDYSRGAGDVQYFEDGAPALDITAPDYNAAVASPTTLLSDSYQVASQAGVYAQDQIKFDDHWVATLSGRYDWAKNDYKERTTGSVHDIQRDEAFSGRAGLAYVAKNGLAPYVSYSTSFYPNSGADFSGNTFDPTEGKQYEIGLKYAPKNVRGTATISLFDLTQTNVVTDDLANPGFSVASGEWRSRGVEFESKLGLTANLEWTFAVAYNDVEIASSNSGDQGNRPGLVPEIYGSTWLDYTFRDGALKGFTFGAGLRYVGSAYADSTNAQKNQDYLNLDLAVRYAIGSSWTAALNVNNVFDQSEYIYDGSSYSETGGRTIRASLAYHW